MKDNKKKHNIKKDNNDDDKNIYIQKIMSTKKINNETINNQTNNINENLTPKVSILMPCYNTQYYVVNAIFSIFHQTYTNWELIIIDDFSTDNTINSILYSLRSKLRTRELDNLIKSRVKQYEINNLLDNMQTVNNISFLQINNIKIIFNNENIGCYESLNKGIIISEGEYFTRLDSDDVFNKDKLKNQIDLFNSEPSLVCVRTYYKRLNKIYKVNYCTPMFKKTIVDTIGYYDSVRFAADSEYMSRVITVFSKNKIKTIDTVLYIARIRDDSLTQFHETKLGCKDRIDYRQKFEKWHKTYSKKTSLYIAYPLILRPFNISNTIINKKK